MFHTLKQGVCQALINVAVSLFATFAMSIGSNTQIFHIFIVLHLPEKCLTNEWWVSSIKVSKYSTKKAK